MWWSLKCKVNYSNAKIQFCLVFQLEATTRTVTIFLMCCFFFVSIWRRYMCCFWTKPVGFALDIGIHECTVKM
jgi:hypothetical protein